MQKPDCQHLPDVPFPISTCVSSNMKRLLGTHLFSVHILKIYENQVSQWHFHIHIPRLSCTFLGELFRCAPAPLNRYILAKCGRTTSSFVRSQRLCKCRTCFSIGGLSRDIARCQDLLCVIEFIMTCDMVLVRFVWICWFIWAMGAESERCKGNTLSSCSYACF